jgi:ribosome small subunit-dependent GTPase A
VNRDSRASAQVLAANVDRVLLMTSMDQDFSVRRLERYLTLIWDSGATPIIVLTKADLVTDVSPFRREAEKCALGFPLLCISSVSGDGIGELRSLLVAGETVVLLGSSGVGKSSLINLLGGAEVARLEASAKKTVREGTLPPTGTSSGSPQVCSLSTHRDCARSTLGHRYSGRTNFPRSLRASDRFPISSLSASGRAWMCRG